MLALRTHAAIAAVLFALAACGGGDEPDPKATARRAQGLQLAPGWVVGSDWPAETAVALRSAHLQMNSELRGDLSVITQSPAPYLSTEQAVIGNSAEVRGHVKAHSLRLRDGAHVIGPASYNALISNGVIDGPLTTPLALPLPITVPNVPDFGAGTQNIEVAARETQTLAPGNYGSVLLRAGTTASKTVLRLSGGVYQLASLDQNDHSRVECLAACQLRIKGQLRPGQRSYLGPSGMSGLRMGDVQVFVEGGNGGGGGPEATPYAAEVGSSSELKGYVFVPNGTLHFRSDSVSVGKFVARDLSLGPGAALQDGTNVVVLPDSWVTGPNWPEQAITALNSLDLNAGAQVTGDAAVITAAAGPTLASGFEANVGMNARLTGNVQADTLIIRSGAVVTGSASYNALTNNGTLQGAALTPLELPLPITVPAFPAFEAGTTVVDVPARADQTLAAGAYGLVRLRAGTAADKTVLTLTGGTYELADLDIADHGRVECAAECELRIKNRIAPGATTYLGPAAGSNLDIAQVRVLVEGHNGGGGGPSATPYAAVFGQSCTLSALVFAPNGTLHVRTNAVVAGRLVAKDVLIGDSTTVTRAGTTVLPPVIHTQPSDVSVLDGYPATFNVVATGTDIQFLWRRGNEDIPGATAGSYTLDPATLADDGAEFRVVVSNSVGSVTSEPARLGVTPAPPEIVTHPVDTTVVIGEPVTLTCAARGTSPSYRWEKNGDPVPGATQPSLHIESAARTHAGEYVCIASNALGTATSAPATLTVTVRPPVITQHPADQAVRVGQSVTFTVAAEGLELVYQWQRAGQDLTGETSATLTLPAVTLWEDGAVFRCAVRNEGGTVFSASATLSVIDDRSVSLRVDGERARITQSDRIVITGTATAGGDGSVTVEIASDRHPGQRFTGTRTQDGAFSIEVPLEPGDNELLVTARDGANNQSQQSVTVTFAVPSAPSVRIGAPLDGATVFEPRIDVSGTVYSSLPPEQIRLELAGTVVFPTGSDGRYAFTFDEVTLASGSNQLVVAAVTALGRSSASVNVTYLQAPPPDQGQPPRIRLIGAASELFVTGTQVPVSGTVDADTCIAQVTINGQPARVTGSGTSVSFDGNAAFGALAAIDVLVRAVDCDGRSAEVSFRAVRDAAPPVIALDALEPPDAVNTVTTVPYRLRGTVSEANLAGLTLNAQSLSAVPQGGDAVWAFAVDVELPRDQEHTLNVEAWDLAGNRASQRVIVRLDAALTVEIVSPRDGASLVQSASQGVAVTARVAGMAADDVVTARIDGGTPVLLARSGDTATATVTVAAGAHQLAIEVHNGSTLLASRSATFSLVDPSQVPLALTRQQPENGARGVEANAFIAFHFNRPIELSRLAVRVFETAHGLTYPDPTEAQDMRTMSDVTLAPVHRDRAEVAGGVSIVPEGTLAAFYPARDFAFGGTVYVEVEYDGAELARSTFAVRPLPTFVQGLATNQFGTPLPGIAVGLPELGLSTVTDQHGAYGFGFGVPADQTIPGGRYRAVFNAGLQDRRYGSAERFVGVEQGRLNRVPVTQVPELTPREPFRYAASGANVTLAAGDLVLDLAAARIAFPDGLDQGPVHAQFMTAQQAEVETGASFLPPWLYAIQPTGIEVAGQVGVTLRLPTRAGTHDYLSAVADLVLVVGRARGSLLLVPVGVGRVDRTLHVVQSVRPVELERLDFIGYAEVGAEQQAVLQRYVSGELSLAALVSELEASR